MITKKLIIKHLGEKTDNKTLKDFVNKFNNVILYNKNNNFKLIEKILKQSSFKNVNDEFKNSTILIDACKNENIPLIKWLLTTDMSYYVQDDQGMTVLMYASKKPELSFVLKTLLSNKKDYEYFYIVDKNGENAFFHAVHNPKAFDSLLESKKMVEKINQLNINNDSVLTYCCRHKFYEQAKKLIRNAYVDPNVFNNDEKTAVMYLVEDGRYDELEFLKKWKTNFEFKNSKNEFALSLLIRQYNKYSQEKNTIKLRNYIKVIKVLIDKGCNFNSVIDEEGNTAFMFFLWIQDWHTIVYLLLHHKDLDFTIKNKNGVNASMLCATLKKNEITSTCKIKVSNIIRLYLSRKEFDLDVKDSQGNNLLIHFLVNNNNFENISKLLSLNEGLVNQVNDKKESPLTIATKLGDENIVKYIITRNVNMDYQDELGNTALHYALESGNKYIINTLAYYHADINIKNREGKSPIEIAKASENDEIINLLKNPVPLFKLNKKSKDDNDDDKRKVTSLLKKDEDNINHVEIDNGDIVISKYVNYQQDYKNTFQFTSKLYRTVCNGEIQNLDISVYNIYDEDGRVVFYSHEIWEEDLLGLIIVDDIEKKVIKNALYFGAAFAGGIRVFG